MNHLHPDRDLGERVAVHLLGALPEILSASQEERRWSADADVYEPVLESMVDLALWPGEQVDAEKLRQVLAPLLKSRVWWTREWAAKQLRRFKQVGQAEPL